MKPINFQATKMYKNQQLLNNLFIYSLTTLTSGLFCFSPFLHPLFSCVRVFLFVCRPQITSLFFSSKFLFIVGSLIIIFLSSESKIFTSYTTSRSDCYDKSLHNLSSPEKKEEANLEKFLEEKIVVSSEGEEWKEEWIEKKENVDEELDGERFGLPVEDLNKRIDDFIARVKSQRMLELISGNQ